MNPPSETSSSPFLSLDGPSFRIWTGEVIETASEAPEAICTGAVMAMGSEVLASEDCLKNKVVKRGWLCSIDYKCKGLEQGGPPFEILGLVEDTDVTSQQPERGAAEVGARNGLRFKVR